MVSDILENNGHIGIVKEENGDWLSLGALEDMAWQCKKGDTKEVDEKTKTKFRNSMIVETLQKAKSN